MSKEPKNTPSKKKKKTGGRPKGSPNKKAVMLSERAKALGVDPFDILLYFAKGDWSKLGYESGTRLMSAGMGHTFEVETIPPDLRVSAAKDACQYIHPKRKALEIENVNPFISGVEKLEVDLRWADETDSEDEKED